MAPPPDVPLCVDLDGTLIKTDLLIESFLGLLKQSPGSLLRLPSWLLHGKARLKGELARRVALEAATLPYNEDFLSFLRAARGQGRRLVLVTASSVVYARQVAGHLGIFDGVIATEGDVNLSGRRKRARLVEDFGEKGFDYAGNAYVDLKVWSHARRAVLVNPAPGLLRAAEKLVPVDRVFRETGSAAAAWAKALRLHQWVKNLLVFVPLVASHQIAAFPLVLQGILAFLAFGFCSSSVYLLNDLLDLSADRQHPRKKHRALAAGRLPILWGALAVPALLAASASLAWLLPGAFQAALGVYYLTTLVYSLRLKRNEMLDVLALAGLWTLRLIAGGAAMGIRLSFWLLAFSMFIFLSLALVKRCAELLTLRDQGRDRPAGRDYRSGDLEILSAFGAACGTMSVLVLALYINSPDIRVLYRRPEVVWLLCPLLLYWIGRVWLKTWRGEMHDDPILFPMTDRASRWLLVAAGCVILLAA